MTGWKMKSGLPLSDWHAALRNWKDFQVVAQKAQDDQEKESQLGLLIPMLLKKTITLSEQKKGFFSRIRALEQCLNFMDLNVLAIRLTRSRSKKWSNIISLQKN